MLVVIAASMLMPTSTAKSMDKGEYHYSDDGKFDDAHESRGKYYNEDTGWGYRNLGRSGKAKVAKPRRQVSKLKEENEGPIPGSF